MGDEARVLRDSDTNTTDNKETFVVVLFFCKQNERDKNVPTFMFKFNFIFNLVCKVFMEGTTMITTQRKIYCKNLELYMHVGEGEKLNLHGELKFFL